MKKSTVSIIPGGCPQFLDLYLDAKTLGRFHCYFQEVPLHNENGIQVNQTSTAAQGAIPAHMQALELVHVLPDDTGEIGAFDYLIDAIKALECFANTWMPVPFLHICSETWADGTTKREKGPSNWARVFIRPDIEVENAFHLVFAFDTLTEERPQDTGQYYALSPDDIAANATFALSPRSRDNAWFLNTAWGEEWIMNSYEAYQNAHQKGRSSWRENRQYAMEHLATYITLLEALAASGLVPVVRVVDPTHVTSIDVDLVLDLGNSRTTGILVETLPQRQTNLNDSYLLQIRDLCQPNRVHTGPFATRVEFAKASFGNERLSARSGRTSPAFIWPSAVRVGPEAERLAQHSVGAEGSTGMSSPKRYLWDEQARTQQWRFNVWGTGEHIEPPVTDGAFVQNLNKEGTPLFCFTENTGFRPNLLRTQDKSILFESRFTRSSIMMFLLSEIIMHALVTINAPATRSEREQPDVPRRLKRLIFTVPSAMPIAEQQIYRRWVTWAVQMVWKSLGWKDTNIPQNCSYLAMPEVRCSWDEATCTQLVYLYNEITEKFQGDARHFFKLMGKVRSHACPPYLQDADSSQNTTPTLRIANVDIGGGTIDLSITTFTVTGDEATAARIRPCMNFRDGFNIAGDDVMHDLVEQHILPCLGRASKMADPRNVLGTLFGRDTVGGSQRNRTLRTQFARQIAAPVVMQMLHFYEEADLFHDCVWELPLSAFFEPAPGKQPQMADTPVKNTEERGIAITGTNDIIPAPKQELPEYPTATLIDYVNGAFQQSGYNFNLMDVVIRIDPHAIDRTVKTTLGQILANQCEIIQTYNCDLLLLTGRPSKWHGVISSFFAKIPVPADRIIPMRDFRVGSWYPFADSRGEITDPKTTVVVGAILCALAEGHLEGFSFDTSALYLKSTARYIGAMDNAGQIKNTQVWFTVDTDQQSCVQPEKTIEFSGPVPIGFRQLDAERWTTTRFYLMDFASPEARELSRNRLPYKVRLRLSLNEDHPEEECSEGELVVEEVISKDDMSLNPKTISIRLQTLPSDEGYWLDTGIFNIV